MKQLYFGLAVLFGMQLFAADSSTPSMPLKGEHGEEKEVGPALSVTNPPVAAELTPTQPGIKTTLVPVSPMFEETPSAITGSEPVELHTAVLPRTGPSAKPVLNPVLIPEAQPIKKVVLPNTAQTPAHSPTPSIEEILASFEMPATPVAEPEAAEQPATHAVPAAPKVEPSQKPGMPEPVASHQNPILPTSSPNKVAAGPKAPDYGVETIDVESGGNWLIKRVIWEDGQRLYEKINSLLKDIFLSRISFFEVRAAADRSLITFFVESGFAQGELHDALEELIAAVERDRVHHQGVITEPEREIQTSAEEKKKKLEQLQADVKAIGDFDVALDNALTEMMRQLNRCMDYERQGWLRFKEIGQEIDDRKARVSFAHMEAAFKNLTAINNYLNGPFANYFTEASQKLVSLADTIKTQVADLKKDGLALRKRLTDVELAEQQAAKEKTDREEKEKADAAKKAAEAKKKTWYSSFSFIWEYPIAFFSRIGNWIASLFGGGKATIKAVSK